jgi:ribosomal protein L18, bacterial type
MKVQSSRDKRLKRNRSKLKKVNVDRFRITVSKSLKNISVQIIDDNNNKTIVSASSKEKDMRNNKINKTKMSEVIGEILAKRAGEKKISKVYFDRGGYKYHGRIKVLADSLRKNGLRF